LTVSGETVILVLIFFVDMVLFQQFVAVNIYYALFTPADLNLLHLLTEVASYSRV
jgi:hypothetical protein